jgi:hypothetical protein
VTTEADAAPPFREIRIEDLRRELTVDAWWTCLRAGLSQLKSTDEGREYMRFEKGPVKRLKEEIAPCLRFAERYFGHRNALLRFSR